MADSAPGSGARTRREVQFVLAGSFIALAVTSVPYLLGAALATDERVFCGFVYAVEDCYSYLAKMRQGAEGAWLFHLPYTPEPHPSALIYPFYLLLGKVAVLLPGRDLTSSMVWVYHVARWVFGFGLLMTVYRFLAAFTERVPVRRLAWLMIAFGGGLGWLLVALGQSDWLGSMPLDFILPEGFTFLALYAFPHIALGRTLLLWGLLWMLEAWQLDPVARDPHRGSRRAWPAFPGLTWALLAGALWLLMGLIVPFYVGVAWAVSGTGLILLTLRERRPPWTRAAIGGVAVLVSMPIVLYSAWRFTSHPIYETWAAQNQILSPHPFHYLAAYGMPLGLAAFAARDAWRSKKPVWLALGWIAVVPLLVYVPFNLQRRLVEGVQVPLSLLAAMGLTKIAGAGSGHSSLRSKLALSVVLAGMLPSNVMLIAGNSMALQGRPAQIFREVDEAAALTWLSTQVEPHDVVLASYGTGNYLPVRVGARAFVGHGPESANAEQKRAQVARFFRETTDDAWRQRLLREYGVDYVFWGPEERSLGGFEPGNADYLQPVYRRDSYVVLEVVR